jgi:hypothetical protein
VDQSVDEIVRHRIADRLRCSPAELGSDFDWLQAVGLEDAGWLLTEIEGDVEYRFQRQGPYLLPPGLLSSPLKNEDINTVSKLVNFLESRLRER